MARASSILVLGFLLVACPLLGDMPLPGGAVYTSLVRVLANPEQYAGKRIQIVGYYHSGFEESALYLTKDDALHLNTQNGIWIGNRAKSADTNRVNLVKRGFVRVAGTFTYDPERGGGHMGLYPAELNEITFFNVTK